jgi:tetratricopeptide (TPR) repeat protein
MYKTINETQQNPNAVRSYIKDEYRQKSYILGALINSTKSNFNMSIDFLENNINEFQNHQYFQERTGYLTYYLLGLNYLALEQIEQAKSNLNRALQMCNSAVNNNINVLKNLYLQERTSETEENINQYIIYLNEASLMIGYIKRALSEMN